ncbi:nitroreductase family protein [Bacillus paralicheniformis]|jgi:putative NAD(P)H nitroreductase|uniref:Nitroreductase family protein n=2 Tax=Bacillus paralicheniformis TaxID=1648923 RepID=A0A6N2GL31_9BACI|nr:MULTISPECIES: nitroreductase family protein [Bacillus]KJD54566.1 NAD(P)H nitroreductase [Bacillus amyloliquefaciens]KUL09290.1 NAD(P)H nitroreductase [Bacillus licheniformis LMG 7559]AGN34672.1 putative oxidoreductase YdfN [Bacillus paralicheniformis ATCC 9945a]AJO16373.1 NAD(P)H nitroreductase ydfN [Bacillus paralicheniformis]ARA84210.1 nitroreductase family protein [Bacillus paralicheniformis]
MEFNELIETRHSANNFLEDVQITVKDLEPIFEDIKLAPSAFNLQHAEYKVVLEKDLKEKIREAASGQYKVHSASAVILVTGDRYAYRQTEKINEGMRDLGIIKDFELQEMVENNTQFYETRGEPFMKEEAIRNASLSAMMFMLAAKNRGWDTCPMIGFDSDQVRELLEIPDTHEIVLMITIGKEKESSRRLRGYRKPVNEFVSFY